MKTIISLLHTLCG